MFFCDCVILCKKNISHILIVRYFRRWNGLINCLQNLERNDGHSTWSDRFSCALSSSPRLSKPLKLSSWETFYRESPYLVRASSRRDREKGPARVPRDTRLDVSCQISEKVVAFCPMGDTASRNTLQSCKGRWDLRDIPQRGSRFPVIQVHILEDSLSQINATFPAGDVSLSTCSAMLPIRPRGKIGWRKFPWSIGENNLIPFLIYQSIIKKSYSYFLSIT